jgi:hypothetical protein
VDCSVVRDYTGVNSEAQGSALATVTEEELLLTHKYGNGT